MNDRCRECGSERIGPLFPLGLVSSAKDVAPQVRARACADCGHMELFAENALDVYLAHQRAVDDTMPVTAPALNIQCPSCGSMLPAASATCEVCGWTEGRA
jgi:DNA-directed RNA polymerase subunit RPC12/RpoP